MTLVHGPVALPDPSGMTVIAIESAEQMLEAILSRYDAADYVIKAAAVADYRPKQAAQQKVKKQQGDTQMELERTPDILATLGAQKTHQLLIGFAAETNDIETYALDKLARKNADYIIANDVSKTDRGFGADQNTVTLYGHDFVQHFPSTSKRALATQLLETIIAQSGVAK